MILHALDELARPDVNTGLHELGYKVCNVLMFVLSEVPLLTLRSLFGIFCFVIMYFRIFNLERN